MPKNANNTKHLMAIKAPSYALPTLSAVHRVIPVGGKYLTVQTFHYCEGVRLEKDERYFEPLEKRLTAFLTRLDAKTGEKLAWIYHPHISEDLYLFHEDKRGWFLFDEGSGDRIIHVPRDKAKHIKFPIY